VDDGGLEAAVLTVSFYYPVSLFIASPLIIPSLKKVDLGGCHCDGMRRWVVRLNGYASGWASYRDAGAAVASCAPCAFFSSLADFDPSFCCCLRNLVNVGPFEELGPF
jgi:hypothetical protein